MICKFTIPFPPRTKKNSQQIIMRGKYPKIIQSKAYREYEAMAIPFLMSIVEKPISTSVNVKASFYMPTRRKVDLVNLEQALCDILVRAGVIADDNSTIITSMDGSRVKYDRDYPRTEVEIEEIKNER